MLMQSKGIWRFALFLDLRIVMKVKAQSLVKFSEWENTLEWSVGILPLSYKAWTNTQSGN